MAKKSIIARELKRERMVAKYAEKRKQLKEAGNYEELDKMPRNSAKYLPECGLRGYEILTLIHSVSGSLKAID